MTLAPHQTLICAARASDGRPILGEGNDFRFAVDESGNLVWAEEWSDWTGYYYDITAHAKLKGNFLIKLKDYFFDMQEIAKEVEAEERHERAWRGDGEGA